MPIKQYVITVFVFNVSVLLCLSNGQRSCGGPNYGVCIEAQDCPSALKSIKKYGSHSFKRCGWNGLNEKVCCTDNNVLDTHMPLISSTTMTTTTTTENDEGSGRNSDMSTEEPTSQKPNRITTESPAEARDPVRRSDAACAKYASKLSLQIGPLIFNGEDAAVGEFPHMIALGYLDVNANEPDIVTLDWKCAGSLISDRYVLTAAHCVIRQQPVTARVGVLRLSDDVPQEDKKDYDIMNITIHPQYVRRTGQNDIALVRLKNSVVFSTNVNPACLYTKSDAPLGLLITGWGKIYSGEDIRSDILQKARVAAIPMDQCNATFIRRLNRSLGSGHLCAGPSDPNAPSDSCQGDSGGPLQFYTKESIFAVVGIISFGITNCGGDSPSVYTRVYHYLDWIEDQVWPA